MAETSSIGAGLSGLDLKDDVESNWHSGSTLESYVLPPNLRIDANETNLALSCMEVIKVSKVSRYEYIYWFLIGRDICYAHTVIH